MGLHQLYVRDQYSKYPVFLSGLLLVLKTGVLNSRTPFAILASA